MNIAESFANYLVDNFSLTLGTDLFIGGVPLSAPDSAWWLVLSGGNNENKLSTGEKIKNYRINTYYRSSNTSDVYNSLHALELAITGCIELEGFEVIEVETLVYPTDQDLDIEDRTVGMIEVNVRVYA